MDISRNAKLIKTICKNFPESLKNTNYTGTSAQNAYYRRMWKNSGKRKPFLPYDFEIESFNIMGTKCEWIYKDDEQKKKVIIYLHAGAYLTGGLSEARLMAVRYVKNTNASVFIPNYRSSAVAPFPAALKDVYHAYKFLIKIAPDAEFIIIGDSAGGGLAVSATLLTVKRSLKLPRKLILNSPWCDLTCSSDSFTANHDIDVMLNGEYLKNAAKNYAGNELKNPLVSPVFASFKNFPPMTVHVGTDEILLSDSITLTEKAKADGAEATLFKWNGMFHMFHYVPHFCMESKAVNLMTYKEINEIV